MKKITVMTLTLLCTLSSLAEKLDINTHDAVINRLESTLPALKNQPNEVVVMMRLANLYADRARLTAIQHEERGCSKKECQRPKNDRDKALSLYSRAFKGSEAKDQAKILLQTAHLHSINGDAQKAKSVFRDIIRNKKRYEPEVIGLAYAGLGEKLYTEGQFNEAQKNYIEALRYPIQQTAFVSYRLAWCELNAGQVTKAKARIVDVLKNEKNIEPSFRKDMVRDLATFIARGDVTVSAVNEMMNLSAEENKKPNLFYLGQECDRLGNKNGSIMIWGMYKKLGDMSGEDALEIELRLAQNLWDKGHYSDSLKQYKKFYKQIDEQGCPNDENRCADLRARSRTYVHTWIKKVKTNPDSNLLGALQTYANSNQDDVEMINWTGHIGRVTKNNVVASQYYRMAADRSHHLLKSEKDKTKIQFLSKTLEGALVAELETAEDSGQPKAMRDAYNHYLQLNPDTARADVVRYQIAHLDYKAGQYAKASEDFHNLAIKKNKLPQNMKIQAADLSLDALNLLKDHETIEKRGLDYSVHFKAKRAAYAQLSRQAAINIATIKFNAGKGSEADQRYALLKLQKVTHIGATNEDRIKIYKNQILIARKLKDLPALDDAANKLLAIKAISADDKKYALSQKLWIADLKLDFDKVIYLSKKVEITAQSEEEQALKSALYTELAGRNAKAQYEKYLRVARNTQKANAVRLKLVKQSARPWNELKKHKAQLRHSPALYGQAVMDAFARDRNYKEANQYAAERVIRNTPEAQVIRRFQNIKDLRDFNNKVARHRIKKSSDRVLQKTLKERISLLTQVEKHAVQANKSGDFTIQVVTLTQVERENNRLYDELMKLPIPRGLSSAEREEYKKMLSARADIFKLKAEQAEQNLEMLWSSSKAYERMIDLAENDSTSTRRLVVDELKVLAQNATSSRAREIRSTIAQGPDKASSREVSELRSDIRKNPFDVSSVEKLSKAEASRGRLAMATFLDVRATELKSGSLQ